MGLVGVKETKKITMTSMLDGMIYFELVERNFKINKIIDEKKMYFIYIYKLNKSDLSFLSNRQGNIYIYIYISV